MLGALLLVHEQPGRERLVLLAERAARLVCDVPPAKRLEDELEVLEAVRAVTTVSADALPAATLCWVWGAAETKGALLPNAYSRRVRYIVLRNREDALATWFEESRDVAADFQRAFGDESDARDGLPPLSALIVAGDGDNSGGASVAHVSALRMAP